MRNTLVEPPGLQTLTNSLLGSFSTLLSLLFLLGPFPFPEVKKKFKKKIKKETATKNNHVIV